jgi:hypothetical protein
MSRPCRWPDGGCGADIIDVITVKGAKQVLDATPTKGIVLVRRGPMSTLEAYEPGDDVVAKVVPIYTDHHATCPKWAAKMEAQRSERDRRRLLRERGQVP